MSPTIEEKHMMGAYFYLAATSLLMMLKIIGATSAQWGEHLDRMAQTYLDRMVEEANLAGCSDEDWTKINEEMTNMGVSLKAKR